MDNDTFTMADVESIPLEAEASEVTPETSQPADETTETAKAEKSKSFIDAFAKANSDDPIEVEPTESEEQPEATEQPDEQASESRSAKDFRLIKEDRDNARNELDRMKAELEKLKDNNVDEVLSNLQAERDELSEQLRVSSIERHPEFRRKFDDRISAVVKNAQSTVGEHNADQIARLLKMDDSEMRTEGIEQIFAELSPSRQAKLGAMLAQVDDIRSERRMMLENSEESYKQLAAAGDAQREAHIAASNKLFDGVVGEARGLEVFAARDGDDEWNGEVNSRIEQARNIFTGDSDAEELARASLWAAAGPKYRELLKNAVELNRRLQAQIKGENVANPTVSGSRSDDSKASEGKSFMDVFAETSGMDLSD